MHKLSKHGLSKEKTPPDESQYLLGKNDGSVVFEAVAAVNDVTVQCSTQKAIGKTQLRVNVDQVYPFMTTVDHFLHARTSSL